MTALNETNVPTDHALITEDLRGLMSHANRLIEGKGVSFDEARRITGYIAEIRGLLTEWVDLENRFFPARPTVEKIRTLKKRSLELEGLVKEIRNGLEREQRPTRSGNERS